MYRDKKIHTILYYIFQYWHKQEHRPTLTLPLLPIYVIATKIAFVLCFKIMIKTIQDIGELLLLQKPISSCKNDWHDHYVKSIEKKGGKKKLQHTKFIFKLIHIALLSIHWNKQWPDFILKLFEPAYPKKKSVFENSWKMEKRRNIHL